MNLRHLGNVLLLRTTKKELNTIHICILSQVVSALLQESSERKAMVCMLLKDINPLREELTLAKLNDGSCLVFVFPDLRKIFYVLGAVTKGRKRYNS